MQVAPTLATIAVFYGLDRNVAPDSPHFGAYRQTLGLPQDAGYRWAIARTDAAV
jgi:hypothetical protein